MVKAKIPSYEDMRQKIMAENKKRMEELNLTKLALAVRNAASPNPSSMKQSKPQKPRKETTLIQVRRSPRVANAPVFKEVSVDLVERPKSYSNKTRDLSNFVYASDEARMNTMKRAEDLNTKFGSGFPSFVRTMLPSHVSGGFWLGLPTLFCKKNLPRSNTTITLVDKNGDEWPTIYLAEKTGLSGGWKAFSRAHELADGDALIFELIKSTKFKVCIVKVNG